MGFLRGLTSRLIRLTRWVLFLVVGYGIVVIVFREAYGIDLPNPVRWLSKHWPRGMHFDL